MKKTKTILWLEEQTGQTLDVFERMPPAPKGRHVSIRVSDELFAQLEAAADTETAIDAAIAALNTAKARRSS